MCLAEDIHPRTTQFGGAEVNLAGTLEVSIRPFELRWLQRLTVYKHLTPPE
jgi:hypothetical protein